MSEFTDELMKKLNFVSKASNNYMHHHKQRLTGQQRVLAILNLEDNLTQSYLQEVLDLRPSSIAELVKKLEDKGDITRSEDESDKRIKRIKLTEQGKTAAEKYANQKNSDTTEKFFQGLGEDEQQQFQANLEKIANGWDPEFQDQASNFVDPMDRLGTMQEIRNELQEKYGDTFDEMSPEDMDNFRKEMRQKMREHGIKQPDRWPMGMVIRNMPQHGFHGNHRRMGHHHEDFRQNWRW